MLFFFVRASPSRLRILLFLRLSVNYGGLRGSSLSTFFTFFTGSFDLSLRLKHSRSCQAAGLSTPGFRRTVAEQDGRSKTKTNVNALELSVWTCIEHSSCPLFASRRGTKRLCSSPLTTSRTDCFSQKWRSLHNDLAAAAWRTWGRLSRGCLHLSDTRDDSIAHCAAPGSARQPPSSLPHITTWGEVSHLFV